MRVGEHEAVRLGPRSEQAARVIEVEMREHRNVDVGGSEAERRERLDEHVAILDDTVTLA
jgi:hypothetical protein